MYYVVFTALFLTLRAKNGARAQTGPDLGVFAQIDPSFERPSSLAFHRDKNRRRATKFTKSCFHSFHHGGHLIALISVTKLIWSLPLLRITNRIMAVTKMLAGLGRAVPAHVLNR
jgi:hypothetical protein